MGIDSDLTTLENMAVTGDLMLVNTTEFSCNAGAECDIVNSWCAEADPAKAIEVEAQISLIWEGFGETAGTRVSLCLRRDDINIACTQKSWSTGESNVSDTLSLFYRENITIDSEYSLVLS